MRRRLVLEHPVATADGAGGVTRQWVELARVWAELSPMGGGEQADYGRIDARLAYRIRIRFRRDVRPDMRFRSGARVFGIQAVYDPDERGMWLDCLSREQAE